MISITPGYIATNRAPEYAEAFDHARALPRNIWFSHTAARTRASTHYGWGGTGCCLCLGGPKRWRDGCSVSIPYRPNFDGPARVSIGRGSWVWSGNSTFSNRGTQSRYSLHRHRFVTKDAG